MNCLKLYHKSLLCPLTLDLVLIGIIYRQDAQILHDALFIYKVAKAKVVWFYLYVQDHCLILSTSPYKIHLIIFYNLVVGRSISLTWLWSKWKNFIPVSSALSLGLQKKLNQTLACLELEVLKSGGNLEAKWEPKHLEKKCFYAHSSQIPNLKALSNCDNSIFLCSAMKK